MRMGNDRLTDKIVWITGAGRGLGRAMATALAAAGARVVLSARTTAEIDEIAALITAHKGQALAIPCDVQKQTEIAQALYKIEQTWGAVDILINNAGMAIFKKIVATELTDWEQTLATNLRGPFLCCKAVLPVMMNRQSGHIINIVSVAGKQPFHNCGAYCASKYGLLGFTEVLRLETRKYGIRVTALMPGAMDTAIWGTANVDRNRMMQPQQVAEAVVALCAGDPAVMIEEVTLRPLLGDLP